MTIKFNTKKFERDLNKSLNKVLQDKVEQIKIKNEVESRGNSMKLLNDVEKEFLKIILDSENVDYNYKGRMWLYCILFSFCRWVLGGNSNTFRY